MRLVVLTALLIALAFTGTAYAETVRCVSTSDHRISVSNNQERGLDELGDSIAISPAGSSGNSTCIFDPATADFVLEGAYVFVAAVDEFLVLMEASANDRLMIYDLTNGDLLLEAEAHSHMLSSSEIVYWDLREDGTSDNCDRYVEYIGYGGSAVIAHEVRYSFAERIAADTGRSRCDYRQ
jgi:hypothetical protein